MSVLKGASSGYSLTAYLAESIVNRYLFPSFTDLYIRGCDLDAWHTLLVEKGAPVGGGNTRLRWYGDEAHYNSFSFDGYRLVSIPQLTVDLIWEGVSAVEAAEMMMEKYANLLRFNPLHSIHPAQSAR